MSLSDVIEAHQASFVPPISTIDFDDQRNYAARYLTRDAKERRMWLKYTFIKKAAEEMEAKLSLIYNPSDAEQKVIELKQAQLTQAALDSWVWQMHDPPRDPGMGWVFANNFPEQRQRMIDLLNLKHDILEQLMILKTKSFPDQEDAMLLFIINTMDPVERQRFLTWLVGNDRSDNVLKTIVGLLPVIPNAPHSKDINGLVLNMAGSSKNYIGPIDRTGNYNKTNGVIPNRLWRRMTNDEATAGIQMAENNPKAMNLDDMSYLFSQLPMGGRNDYTLPTPYTANVNPVNMGNQFVTLAPLKPGWGSNLAQYFSNGANVANRIEHILSGLKSNAQ